MPFVVILLYESYTIQHYPLYLFRGGQAAITPTVTLFTEALEANIKRAHLAGLSESIFLSKQLAEEKEHNLIWRDFVRSISLDFDSLRYQGHTHPPITRLNNWLWMVNSNPRYGVGEGIASLYAMKALIIPLAQYLLPSIKVVASSKADLRWFELHTCGEELKHVQKGASYLESHPLEEHERLYTTVKETQDCFAGTFCRYY